MTAVNDKIKGNKMVLEILQYVTSGFWIFIGSIMFSSLMVLGLGWSLNAMFIGIRGKKCDNVSPF